MFHPDAERFSLIVCAWIALALVLFPVQLVITAPYGRHRREGLGPQVSNRLGWILMELVALLSFAGFFLAGASSTTWPVWVAFGLWVAHYVNRSLMFPLRIRTAGKSIPLVIVVSGALFNLVNGWMNGAYLGGLGPGYPREWATDPRFLIGLAVFCCGAAVNVWADHRLIGLRRPGDPGYQVPHGGLFEYVSCPNHLGEIVQWTGFALMCWNLPALSFAVWTAANLIPRALSHHRWYCRTFSRYPAARKAVIPLVL